MNKWNYTIIVIVVLTVASVFILATQPPEKYITICDESHTVIIPVTTFIHTGSVSVPVTNMIPTKVCDVSHEELNPEWLEQ
jgi:hypothetical protein